MSPILYTSLALNAVAAVYVMVLLASRAVAREVGELAADRGDEIAELKAERKVLEQVNGSMLAELTEFRAAKAKRLANLSRGTPKNVA